ncbi:MAG: 3-dehydroquinate dehydratase [Lachnospiraceae bacterium]|nr:3-dehydroquinate dehydratase [Lachnospiraceae bacterium]
MKMLVINGPNLNFLGIRDRATYGENSYDHLVKMIVKWADEHGHEAECYQSNHEGDLIDRIQRAYFDGTAGIVINPGALTHYSYALYDALGSYDTIPMVEVHISDINSRDEFRKTSVTAPACDHQIIGHGLEGYTEGLEFIEDFYSKDDLGENPQEN